MSRISPRLVARFGQPGLILVGTALLTVGFARLVVRRPAVAVPALH